MPDNGSDPDIPASAYQRWKHFWFGRPRDLADRSVFHRIALVPLLAWIGLGADGLSSSSYGPEEAFRTLGEHTFLAIGLAAMVTMTILIIATAYGRIIERFPHGGGGYIVATNLLGPTAGAVSGSALLIDYVLTIAVSIASAGDALFSFFPSHWLPYKLTAEAGLICLLILINIRGVKESVLAMAPIFILFLITHIILIGGGLLTHAQQFGPTVASIAQGYHDGRNALGFAGLLFLLLRAFSYGAGTFTGLEAVSNGLPIIREPKIQNAKRTMFYMASSLALTASGLLFCYLLFDVAFVPGKTLNAVLAARFTSAWPAGSGVFIILTLLSEGALLIVAAQTGFLDGPRVLANMAHDSWTPKHFASLSDRLTTQNGVLTMGVAALAALAYTRGDIRTLVLMYSINVFVTFSLSMLGMLRDAWRTRKTERRWRSQTSLFLVGFIVCATILGITVTMKFREGGWLTIVATCLLVLLFFWVRSHYRKVGKLLAKEFAGLEQVELPPGGPVPPIDATKPTAAVLVSRYGGLGIHTVLNAFKLFPNRFANLVFLSVGPLDSTALQQSEPVEHLRGQLDRNIEHYQDLAARMGIPSVGRSAVGTDLIYEAERLCVQTAREFSDIVFFAGKLHLPKFPWYYSILHNDLALSLQKRLELKGYVFVVIPSRLQYREI